MARKEKTIIRKVVELRVVKIKYIPYGKVDDYEHWKESIFDANHDRIELDELFNNKFNRHFIYNNFDKFYNYKLDTYNINAILNADKKVKKELTKEHTFKNTGLTQVGWEDKETCLAIAHVRDKNRNKILETGTVKFKANDFEFFSVEDRLGFYYKRIKKYNPSDFIKGDIKELFSIDKNKENIFVPILIDKEKIDIINKAYKGKEIKLKSNEFLFISYYY